MSTEPNTEGEERSNEQNKGPVLISAAFLGVAKLVPAMTMTLRPISSPERVPLEYG